MTLHDVEVQGEESFDSIRKNVVNILNRCVKDKRWREEDIVRSHRLGKGTNTQPPPIIIRFHQFMDKLSVLRAREEFKRVKLGVSNDLTRRQRQKLADLRARGLNGYYKGGRLITLNADGSRQQSSGAAGATGGQHRRVFTARRRLNQDMNYNYRRFLDVTQGLSQD